MFIRTVILILILLWGNPAFAHRPYYHPLSDWKTFNDQQYRIEGWYGDGIVGADPVRIVLRHKNGGLSAVSGLGNNASVFCPSIHYCWGFTFIAGMVPQVWRLDPQTITALRTAIQSKTNENRIAEKYPNYDKTIKEFGFEKSYNIILWVFAFMVQAIKNPIVLLLSLIAWSNVFYLSRKEKSQKLKQNKGIKKIISALINLSAILISLGLLLPLLLFSMLYAYGSTLILSYLLVFGIFKLIDFRRNAAAP